MTLHETDITVIVTYHNQALEDLLFTLESCIRQKGVSFDIVIADDCSNEDASDQVNAFFEKKGFSDYLILRQEENVKTVRNIRLALSCARGKYVKTIGTEDIFFSADTLAQIVGFCEKNELAAGFGKCLAFSAGDAGFSFFEFNAPVNKELYAGAQFNDDILSHQLQYADWIPGGAQFFEKKLFLDLLNKLDFEFDIKYCEDFAATVAFLDPKFTIGFLNEYIIFYAIGSGISTATKKSKPYAMYKDNELLYRRMRQEKPSNAKIRFANHAFHFRKLLALHTPFYDFFRQIEFRRRSRLRFPSKWKSEFFDNCRAPTDDNEALESQSHQSIQKR